MGIYSTIVRPVLPTSVRGAIQPAHRNMIFRRGLRRMLKNPWACTDPNCPAIEDFLYGWDGVFCARHEYIAGCIDHALTAKGPILECGSGLTTVVIGALAKSRGLQHWAMENSPEWADKLRRTLRACRLDNVRICAEPLKDYGDFDWYDPPLAEMPRDFAMVVCDGPPGATKGGRYGLLPVMRDHLRKGAVILLDDAGRDEEYAIACRWKDELGTELQMRGEDKPYAEIRV